ncbi:non-ribosomal peptide synthetase [Actinocrispum wychmicini]|uniref:Amino acid adenylation domain-containing protein n=1 Tax=Actinocrispum wychmicini TaxID=1213861 RepID=A0A4R2JV56_9PSEU|nr:non-ribosomal peptide synthetase [Actinocrispum wychmicini]TCO61176.1 amino acid adenylation domain-containing protein [Actinocrispum wychmicini]
MDGPIRYHDSVAVVHAESDLAVNGIGERTVPKQDSQRFVASAIRMHAAAQPDAPAIVVDGGTVTYRQLYDRACRMAVGFADLVPRADDVVAVYLPRGDAQVTAAVAAIVLGRPYLLIDVEQPSRRARDILTDSSACVVVTDEEQVARLSSVDIPVVLADRSTADVSGPPKVTVGGELAYLCYTSGSSGSPKGVRVTHHGLANLVAWYTQHYQVTPADRMTQLASPSFDAWVLEVWPCLANGAALYVAAAEICRSPRRLRDWLLDNEITVCFLPTPLAVAVLAEPWPCPADGGPALRAMLTGGDRLARPPAEKPPFRLFNNYGPTECTVVATCAEVLDFGSAEPPPIGRPIPSVRAYVLDPGSQPCPVSEAGELCLGGPAVAAGYVDASVPGFVPDPHTDMPDGLMYRTGDLVHRNAAGDLHFVGRVDNQIKVNGVRIEPGEVESVLLRHPDVQAAAVVLHRTPDNADHLVAYVVTSQRVDEHALRGHMASYLPKLMTPHVIVFVDALSVTSHGKLDRAELSRRPLPSEADGEPADTVEARLRALWGDVLRVATIERTDDFFALGGDSLRVLRFINKARRVGIELVPEDLYTHPVLSDLARHVDRGQAAKGAENDG